MAANNLAPALTPHLPWVDGGVGINSYRMRKMPLHREKVIGQLRVFSKPQKHAPSARICSHTYSHTQLHNTTQPMPGTALRSDYSVDSVHLVGRNS